MYHQNILDEIKDRVSIAALIGERIPLKKAGRNFKGVCPFHSEKTPSFMVSDEKQIYHCFGCGEGGNVFNFFMKFDNLSFKEAVELVAERAGVSLPKPEKVDSIKEDAAERHKRWAYRLNQVVADYFHENLEDSKKGADARNYLNSRNLSPKNITQHFLGYADDSWDTLVAFLEKKNVPLELAVELGLIKKREQGGGYYDFFRHRVMCPVITPRGQVVAFSGRTFGSPKTAEGREEPAKYLNSPDSVIYHKSYTLYGLDVAVDQIRKEDFVILVEGNLDTLRLHQEGIKNAVAPLGTALTSGHLKLLSRYTKNFVVIFDGDEAGRKAANRSLPLFLEASLVPRVVALPNGEDPDSFVRKKGADLLRELIDKAVTLFEWVIDDTTARFGNSTDGKVKAVEELKPLFMMVTNPVEMAVYRKRLASRLMLDESVLSTSLSRRVKRQTNEPSIDTRSSPIERALVELILSYPETVEVINGLVSPDLFSDGAYQTIVKMVLDELGKSGKFEVDHLVENIEDVELKREVLSLAMIDEKYDNPIDAAKDCARRLKNAAAKRRLDELSIAIQNIGKDDEKLKTYMAEFQKITKDLHSII